MKIKLCDTTYCNLLAVMIFFQENTIFNFYMSVGWKAIYGYWVKMS